jgi:hypothetical protein
MAQDAYLTDAALLAQNPEATDLSRQRKLAEMLSLKAFEQPQGNMVSGRYVAPSWTQQLAPLISGIAGQSMNEKLDKKQLALAEALRVKKDEVQQQIMTKLEANDTKGALAIASKYPEYAKEFIAPLLGNVIPKAQEPQQSKVVSPGGALIGPDGKLIYQAPYKPTAGEGMGGMDTEGRFNKKGDYIAPGGVYIGKSEVAKDREIARSANELRQGLKQLTPEEIKATGSILGDVNAGGPISYLAKQFKNPAVAAQAKVNASAVMQTLQNLPPGPASDKDILQAKSSFPGYGNPDDLQEWVNNTQAMLDRKISNVNQKYGSENWYGAQGISNAPTGGNNDLAAAAAAERQRRKGNK